LRLHEHPVHRFDLRAEDCKVGCRRPIERIKGRRATIPGECIRVYSAALVERVLHPTGPAREMGRPERVISDEDRLIAPTLLSQTVSQPRFEGPVALDPAITYYLALEVVVATRTVQFQVAPVVLDFLPRQPCMLVIGDK